MRQRFFKLALFATFSTALISYSALQGAIAQITPTETPTATPTETPTTTTVAPDGLICIARGIQNGNYWYYYTSLIDDASINQKRPVGVTITQTQAQLTRDNILIVDKRSQTINLTNIRSTGVSVPRLKPVGSGTVTYTGDNTFTGKTKTGAPISFSLLNDNSRIQLTHAGNTYSGVCS